MKTKIATGLIAISLATQVFALTAQESTVVDSRYNIQQSKVRSVLEQTFRTYSQVVNSEVFYENVQKVCSSDIEDLTLDAVRSTGTYDKWNNEEGKDSEENTVLNVRIWQDIYIPMCTAYISNYVGREIGFSLGDSSGMSMRFSTTQYCVNYSLYLRHIQKRKDLSLSFATFVSRLPTEKFDIISRISDSITEMQAHALITNLAIAERLRTTNGSKVDDKLIFSTMPFIDLYFNKNNKSKKRHVGGNDLELKKFLALVVSKDFYNADKILKVYAEQSRAVIKKAEYICNETNIYK